MLTFSTTPNELQEVGEDSKLARSFERIRSIVRKKRNASKEKNENDTNTRLEKLVNEIVIKQREEKKKYTAALVASKDQTIVCRRRNSDHSGWADLQPKLSGGLSCFMS
ncbi:uncharacterized protein LOC110680638 [Aedes aegypti]|uniref:Uncharacterized protein n=1 Tax=Aedes aegypti TaxID=7159 RepID=A0A903VQX6_AEDAE|nr:uncharacterized protein LOC110680638 [Aedes aegypti]